MIPVAERTFPSTLGSVGSPITAPGKTVSIKITPCDASPGFESVAASNTVEVVFEPPGPGADTIVPITLADGLAVGDCVLPGGRCGSLRFTQPDTDSVLPPDGLAGPARITVRDASNVLIASIDALYAITTSCDRSPENVFQQLTVLPKPNSYADAANGIATTLRATIDGSGSLLVPLDYWGGGTNSVLAETPGAPVAVFLKGSADIPAMGAGDTTTIKDAIAAQATPSDFVRSFTLNGRPLPPLLRITNTGTLFGTSDTIESVLRIARSDGMGGPNLFDLSDRLSAGGRGPLIIASFSAAVNDPVPLQGLRSTSGTVAYTRDELREATNLNSSSGDGDTADSVCEVVDAVSGTSTSTGKAVTQVSNGFFAASALLTSDGLTAFLESETAQNNSDLDGNGNTGGNLVRVYDDTGTDLTASVDVTAAIGRQVDGRALAISGSKIFFRTPGEFVGTLATGVAGPVPPDMPQGIVISADGAYVYVTSGEDWLSVLSRDAMTGALTLVEAQFDGLAGVTGLNGAAGMAFSPDGAFLYVAGYSDDSIVVFSRDSGTGVLSYVDTQLNNAAGVVSLDGPRQLAVSPDGAHLYVAANLANAVVAFSRDLGTGALTFVEAEVDGASGVDGLGGVRDIVVSPDGAQIYTTARADQAVATFNRNGTTGELTFIEAQFDNPSSDTGFRDARNIAISPDGEHVFATGNSGVASLVRDTMTGVLTQQSAAYSYFGTEALEEAQDVVVSGDSALLYIVGGLGTGLSSFRINPVTSELTFLQGSLQGVGGVTGFNAAQELAITPDGSQVYVHGGADQIVLFRTQQQLGVFDSGTTSVLSPQPAAEQVAVAGQRAVILTPEVFAGVDLNGDGDALTGGDTVAQLYDASGVAPVLINLGVASSAIAIGNDLVALNVREGNENQSSPAGQDLNGDGDVRDEILAVYAIADGGSPQIIGVASNNIGVVDDMVVFLTPEFDEGPAGVGCAATVPPGGCDLNGDDDNQDWVIRIYRSATNDILSLGLAAQEFVITGHRIAFRVSEDAQAQTDLNEDGGVGFDDDVMFIYDIDSGELINTKITSFTCDLPGCEPSTPYKLKGDTVSFLTFEEYEGSGGEGSGRDRNGDGDVNDVVLTVYNLVSRKAQFVTTVVNDFDDVDPLAPAPLPTEDVGGGTTVYVTAKESDIGEDVNGDGVINDAVVVLLAGDKDEDGTFDDLDTCLTTPNAAQTDVDGDRLGDGTCDPNIECPPQPIDDCRGGTVLGKSKLTIKSSDNDDKDSVKWTWVNGSATQLADFGDPANGDAAFQLCVYDAAATEKRVASSRVAPGGTCAGKPCWSPKGTTGYKFSDKNAAQEGIKILKLKAGADGKAKIMVKAKGPGLDLRGLPATTPVIAQLVVHDGTRTECWESRFSTADKSDAGLFKAKGD